MATLDSGWSFADGDFIAAFLGSTNPKFQPHPREGTILSWNSPFILRDGKRAERRGTDGALLVPHTQSGRETANSSWGELGSWGGEKSPGTATHGHRLPDRAGNNHRKSLCTPQLPGQLLLHVGFGMEKAFLGFCERNLPASHGIWDGKGIFGVLSGNLPDSHHEFQLQRDFWGPLRALHAAARSNMKNILPYPAQPFVSVISFP